MLTISEAYELMLQKYPNSICSFGYDTPLGYYRFIPDDSAGDYGYSGCYKVDKESGKISEYDFRDVLNESKEKCNKVELINNESKRSA